MVDSKGNNKFDLGVKGLNQQPKLAIFFMLLMQKKMFTKEDSQTLYLILNIHKRWLIALKSVPSKPPKKWLQIENNKQRRKLKL